MRVSPDKRARELLLRFLSEEQRESIRRYQFMDVRGRSGYRYRLCDYFPAGLFVLRPSASPDPLYDMIVGSYGIYLPNVPQADNVLAQKLVIERNEGMLQVIACGGIGMGQNMTFYTCQKRCGPAHAGLFTKLAVDLAVSH